MSNTDFDYLVENHPREVACFHPLVPHLPPVCEKGNTLLVAPVFAIQITLFPNSGISFGFTSNHVVADGNSFFRFIKLWAFINKSQTGLSLMLEGPMLPFYDRTMVKDPSNIGAILRQQHQKIKYKGYRPPLPTSNVLATFLLSQAIFNDSKKGL